MLTKKQKLFLISKPYLWRLREDRKGTIEYDWNYPAYKVYQHVLLGLKFKVYSRYAYVSQDDVIARFHYVFEIGLDKIRHSFKIL